MRNILSFHLVRNADKCITCGECTKLLPEFISKYNGKLIISESNYRQAHVKHAVQDVIDACSQKAISIEMNER